MNAQEVERSIQEVWTLFKETDERIARTNRESDEKFNARIALMNRETDERIALMNRETDERIARTNRESDEKFNARIALMNRETDERIARTNSESDEKFNKHLARMNRETNRQIGALVGKWGQFVEGLIAPGAVAMFRERGVMINRVFQRVSAQNNGSMMEIDILGVNGEYAVLIEAKSTLTVSDVEEHGKRMGIFKRFFPEYADKKVVGAVAGIVINKGVDVFAYKNGFFVIGQAGDAAAILNESEFLPRVW